MDIHTYFNLSYSAYLVLDRDDVERLKPMLDELKRAFANVPQAHEMLALAGECSALEDLGEPGMSRWGVTYDESEETGSEDEPYSYRGESYEGREEIVFPAETEQQARAAGRLVLNRTLLQSMPMSWQERFVEQARDPNKRGDYDVRCYDATGREIDDPVPHYNRGRTHLEPLAVW